MKVLLSSGRLVKFPEGRRPKEILLNDPHRAGGLIANTPHFMVLLCNIMFT